MIARFQRLAINNCFRNVFISKKALIPTTRKLSDFDVIHFDFELTIFPVKIGVIIPHFKSKVINFTYMGNYHNHEEHMFYSVDYHT